jgi:hypothetical protein
MSDWLKQISRNGYWLFTDVKRIGILEQFR